MLIVVLFSNFDDSIVKSVFYKEYIAPPLRPPNLEKFESIINEFADPSRKSAPPLTLIYKSLYLHSEKPSEKLDFNIKSFFASLATTEPPP